MTALSPSGMQRLWRRVHAYADRCTIAHDAWIAARTDDGIDAAMATWERAFSRLDRGRRALCRREQDAVIAAYGLH